jgi:urate oxidase
MGTRLLADHEGIEELAFTAENHTRDPVGEQDGRKVYTDPFPAQGLITLTLTR